MGPIYLDNQATTRTDPRVVEAMLPYFTEIYGNASSRSHLFGTEARAATERARGQIATFIHASPKEILFTSGATESNNLALIGAVRARRAEGRRHIVTIATEHPAVLDPCHALVREGATLTVLPVDNQGLVDPDAFAAALRPDTAIASVMWVNNEIGVRQPIDVLGQIARERGVWMHCDAAQCKSVPIDWSSLPVDLLSLSAHKLYGPKGIGALVVRRRPVRVQLEPIVYGGGHERGMRSGTLAVPLIVGFGQAAEILAQTREEPARLARLSATLLAELRRSLDGVTLLGHPTARSPDNLNLAFDGVEAAALLVAVRSDLALSTGSACSSETLSPSHVLRALSLPDALTHRAIRIGLGRFNTDADIARASEVLIAAVRKLRSMADLYETE